MRVKVKKLTETALLPKYAHDGDIGADLFSDDFTMIWPGERKVIKTGISLEVPDSFMGYVRIAPRSGLSSRGIDLSAGVVDKSYRGEIGVVVINNSKETFIVEKGHKIAQMIFEVATTARFEQVTELSDTERGDGGFGSTG